MNRLTGNGMVWKSNHVIPANGHGKLLIPFPRRTVVTSVKNSQPPKGTQ